MTVGAFQGAIAAGAPYPAGEQPDLGWAVLLQAGREGTIALDAADLVFRGSQLSDAVGARVVFPGDVDGDGDGEFLVTSLQARRPNGLEGAGFLLTADAPGSYVPEDAAVHFLGGGASTMLGGAAPVGDLDGDGLAEVLLSTTNTVRIYRGSDWPAVVDPDQADIMIPSGLMVAGTGITMVAADSDEVQDLASAEPNWDGGRGRALVAMGPLLEYEGPLSDAPIVLEGEIGRGSFGVALASGDLDGDGKQDLVVTAPGADGVSGERSGRAYVFFGPLTAGVVAAADADVRLEGENQYARLGLGAVVLDHDGDGIDDLAVAAPSKRYLGPAEGGIVYVFAGPLAAGPLDPVTAAVVYQDAHLYADLGWSMAGCDLDGDGDDELVVGAPWTSYDSAPSAGRVVVVDGGQWRSAL